MLTFEEYKKEFRTWPNGTVIETTEEDYKEFCEHWMILEFLGYEERPNIKFIQYLHEYEANDERIIERGLFVPKEYQKDFIYSTGDHFFIDDLTFDWNFIMNIWNVIRTYPTVNEQPDEPNDGDICVGDIEIHRHSIILQVYKYKKGRGWIRQFINNDIYLEHEYDNLKNLYYRTIVDFIKIINN